MTEQTTRILTMFRDEHLTVPEIAALLQEEPGFIQSTVDRLRDAGYLPEVPEW